MNISSPYLDTIISLALIYALLSILVSILLEIWNQHNKERGKTLQNSIFKLLNDPLNHNFGYLIYQHPIINRMRKDENSYPAYISADNFCNAFLDVISQFSIQSEYKQDGEKYIQVLSKPETLEQRIKLGVENLHPSEFKDLISNFISRNTENGVINIKALKTELGAWYDDYMDRVGGQYKTNNRPKMIGIGLIVAIVLNVDTIHLTKVFFLNQELRNRMVAEAEKVNSNYQNFQGNENEKLDFVLKQLKKESDSIELSFKTKKDSIKKIKNDDSINKLRNEINKDSIIISDLKKTKDSTFVQKQLIRIDSANKARMDIVFKSMSRWDIPIGYNSKDAPISWIENDTKSIKDYRNTAQENVLIEYFESRNQRTFWGIVKWIIGILISGIALGYGAPFWFDTLNKLINLRNAGQKPLKMNQNK